MPGPEKTGWPPLSGRSSDLLTPGLAEAAGVNRAENQGGTTGTISRPYDIPKVYRQDKGLFFLIRGGWH